MARLLGWFPEIEGSTGMHFFSGLLGGIRNERTMEMRYFCIVGYHVHIVPNNANTREMDWEAMRYVGELYRVK